MPAHAVQATGASKAPPARIFALLADIDTWSRWGTWVSTDLESPDAEGGGGVGAVRCLRSRTLGTEIVSRERVVELVPERLLVYELLSGLPLRGYQGRVELSPDEAGGTNIRWSSSFDAQITGTGWFYALVLRRFIQDAIARLSRAAEAEA